MTSLTPEDGPAWTAVRISAYWERARRGVEAGLRLKVADGRLLWLLRDGQARTLRQVADDLGLEQSTVNRQVHAALESGVIRRFREEGHSAWLLEITGEGRQRFRTDLDRQLEVHQRALDAVPAEHRADFLTHLRAYVEAIGEAAAETRP